MRAPPSLERGDVDRRAGAVHVRRVYTDGTVKPYGKQSRSLRAVPLPLRAAQALDELPVRLDTRLLFPGEQGGFLNLHNWRRDEWNPAVRAAGLEHRTPYALRHTYASFAIAAGVSLLELSRFMGTSVEQIDRTYGHLLPDSLDRTRAALDAYVAVGDAETIRRAEAMSDDYRRDRLPNGWIDLSRDEDGIWRISWHPDEGHPGFPGRTYSPGDEDLPADYRGPDDPDALIEWGRKRWGDL